MTAKRLRFVLRETGRQTGMPEIMQRFMPNGKFVLNSTEWRGKEPRSCAVTNVHSYMDEKGWRNDLEVTYRPKGHIWYTGSTKYDGWTAMMLDQKPDGTLLDGKGQPLPDDAPRVYLPFEVYHDIEYNALDFGEFLDEAEIENVARATTDALLQELKDSGKASMGIRGSFMAPHRDRPLKKILLANAPSAVGMDGFGTYLIVLNLQTPHVEFVLMEQLHQLMCEFIEGKSSMLSWEGDGFTFAELSGSLVDCSPNEQGLNSWFDVLHMYTPIGFLEDLAKRIMAVYAVDVSIVEGKKGGLVFRHEQQK